MKNLSTVELVKELLLRKLCVSGKVRQIEGPKPHLYEVVR